MPAPAAMEDQQIADVLTYARNAWGNHGEPVTAAEVKKVRTVLAATDSEQNDPFAPLPKAPAGYQLRGRPPPRPRVETRDGARHGLDPRAHQ